MARLAIQMLFFCFNQNDQSTAFRIYFIQRLWIQSATSAKYNRINSSLVKQVQFDYFSIASNYMISIKSYFRNKDDYAFQSLSYVLSDNPQLLSFNLDFYNNRIGKNDSKFEPEELAKCTNLQSLTLSLKNNKIKQWGLYNLLSRFSNCQIKEFSLNLRQNYINNVGAFALSSLIAKYTFITSLRYKKLLSQKLPNASTFILDLNLNTIRLQYLSALGSANFQNLTDLTIIGLSNIILDESLILKSMLSNCGHTLQNLLLDLEKSNIGNKSQLNLCQGLASCINMSTLVLNMSYVWISNEFFKQFSSTQFEQLESLTLDVFYRADSSQHSDICYALQACQKVSHLNLKLGNFFDDDESAEKKLYPALAKCQDVKSLNLKLLRRQINQSYFSVLGNILVSFTKLQILELELGNFKEGNLFVNLVQHLANCKSLFKLKLTLFYYNEDNNVILSEDPTNQGLVLTQCEKLYILELNISFPRLGYAPEKLYQMKLRQHLKKSKRLVNFLY
ncbi:hypothetical protein ABPG74_006729 [Tetrahymena malaccensis]